ncbi:hypothetical protein A1D29_07475 [Pasteurellaceae bacterium Orientalotternb1]|nr:hypothetical protein A1D29_07475 [Pasteurellaceae bacterium Orientalotternb1]
MRISQVQPMPAVSIPLVLVKTVQMIEKPKREVPNLSPQDIAIFAHLERRAKAMTLDDLMQSMGIN